MQTQPEPINHNELKRLLIEVVGDIVDRCENQQFPVALMFQPSKEQFKNSLFRKIDNAILNGDDS